MHNETDSHGMTPMHGAWKRTNWKTRHYAMYVFVVLFFINFANYFDRYLLAGAANGMAKQLHLGIEGIGYLASAYLVFSTLGIIPLGMWADRAKRKNVIALCVAIWSIAAAATGLSWNFLMLLIWRMVGGIGEAGYGPASGALIADFFNRSRRTRMLSWWSVASLLGFMIGTITGGVMGSGGMWRWAFVLTGIAGLVLAWLAWHFREPRRNLTAADALEYGMRTERVQKNNVEIRTVIGWKSFWGRLRTLLHIKSLIVVMMMQGGAFFVLYTSGIYLPTLLQQSDLFGLSSVDAGLLSGGIGAFAGIAGTLLGGYLADALMQRWSGVSLLIGGVAFLVSTPCLVLSIVIGLTTHNIILSSIFCFAMFLLLNMFEGPALTVAQEVVPPFQRAWALATTSLIASLLGESFSSPLVGVMAGIIDPTHGQHFLQGRAGYDLGMALVYTCVPVLVLAGLFGILGARWVKADVEAAQRAEHPIE